MTKYFSIILLTISLIGCSWTTKPSELPIIRTFSFDSSVITLGNTATLRWEVLGDNTNVRIDPIPGNVDGTGNRVFVPSVKGTMNFTITASNSSGSVQQITQLLVQ